jgi:GNAT superfamily N-acetyltransferase
MQQDADFARQRRWRLRRATLADSEFVYQVKKAALGPYVAQTWGWDEDWQLEYHAEHFDPDVLQIIVVEEADAGVLNVIESTDDMALNEIYLTPELQGQGLGSEIIQGILSSARERSKPVRLRVLRVNPVLSLYLRLGFELCGEDKRHIQMEWLPREDTAARRQSSR